MTITSAGQSAGPSGIAPCRRQVTQTRSAVDRRYATLHVHGETVSSVPRGPSHFLDMPEDVPDAARLSLRGTRPQLLQVLDVVVPEIGEVVEVARDLVIGDGGEQSYELGVGTFAPLDDVG